MIIKPVRNNVIFQFVDETVAGKRFVNQTFSGILIHSSDTNQSGVPRWAKVTHVGPDAYDVEVGEYVLVENGMWTTGFTVRDDWGVPSRYWKTEDSKILMAADEPQTTY